MKMYESEKAGFVESDGFKLGYQIVGTGIPALVIGSSLYYPRTFSSELAKHLRLIFVDHRGFAGSSAHPVDNSAFDLDVLLDDIELMRKTLGIERCIIIGHSGHGYLALEYAKKYPEHVSHVVMIATAPNLSSATHKAADQYFQEEASPERKAFLDENLSHLPQEIAAYPEKRFITILQRLGARSWYDFAYDSRPLWKDVAVNMQAIDYIWGTVFRDIDISKGLETFTKPVLLVLGRYDFLISPPSAWDSLKSQFRDITVLVFEKSSHTPQLEEPELFDKTVLDWMSSKNASLVQEKKQLD